MANYLSIIFIIVMAYVFIVFLFVMAYMKLTNRGSPKKETLKDSQGLEADILNEINALPVSSAENLRIAKKIKDVLDKKTSLITQEVNQKYEKVLKEKEEEYKNIDKKFTKTLNEKMQTETVIRSMAQGLIVLDNKGEVVMMNPVAEKLLAVEKEKQIGKPLDSCITDKQLVSLTRKNGEGKDNEVELSATNEDTKKVIRSSTAIIEDENGQTVGMVSVLTDITKQKELDSMKAQFVASVSHELRTPIFATRNSIALILNKSQGSLTPEQEKFLTIADRNLGRLSALIDELLDMSKLEAKKMELRLENNSIRKIIDETCDTLNSWVRAKDIVIMKTINEDLPEFKCDALRVTQVLTNLIGNAIKFTPKKGLIVVEAKISEDKKFIVVSVSDNGIGIAKENLSKLFTKFTQVGERSGSDISGTGLGLALAKELVELHGGTIGVESAPEKGTTFTFTLPI